MYPLILFLAALPALVSDRIPISFTLPEDGFVTLVIEQQDAEGNWLRTRNLIQNEPFAAGRQTVYWDGYDFGMPDRHHHARYDIIHRPVRPGTYRVRGLFHTGIDLEYEFSVYQPGHPPWQTSDPSSGWLGEHGPPASALFLPDGTRRHRGVAQMMISSTSGEVYANTAYVDLDGNKLYGRHAGHFIMHLLARDVGDDPFRAYDAYSITDMRRRQDDERLVVFGLLTDTRNPNETQEVGTAPVSSLGGFHMGGLAVWNGIVVASSTLDGKLHVIDARKRELIGSITMPMPTGVAFDPQGRLYVSQGVNAKGVDVPSRVARFDWSPGRPLELRNEQTVIERGLTHPQHIVIRDGKIFVGDWGFRDYEPLDGREPHVARHQIRVFDLATFRHLYDVGTPGGPQLGRYDETRMHRPRGFDIDSRGQLWVAEHDMAPRRVSIWNASDGSFIRAIYGNSKYGGGGTFHPTDRTRMFYSTPSNQGQSVQRFNETIEFKVDWDNPQRSRPYRILWRHALGDSWHYSDGDHFHGMAPELPHLVNGRLYLTNWHQNGGGSEPPVVGIWKFDENEERLRFVAAVGAIGHGDRARWDRLNQPDVHPLWAGRGYHGAKSFFSWTDLNGNGRVEPEELQFRRMHPAHDYHWPNAVGTGFIAKNLDYTSGMGFRIPVRFEGDLPIYDLDDVERLALVHRDNRYGGDGPQSVAWIPEENRAIHFGGPITGFEIDPDKTPTSLLSDSKGTMVWAYHVQTPTSSSAVGADYLPRFRGDVHRMMRYINQPFAPEVGEAGGIVAISAYHGSVHVLTSDGLYLTDLGADSRMEGNWMDVMGEPPWQGKSSRGRGLRGESYFHSLSPVVVDGRQQVIFQGGGDTNIFTVKGFESVRRLDLGTIEVTEAHLAGLEPARRISTEQPEGREAVVSINKSITVDGDPADWRGAWLDVDLRRDIRAQLAIGPDRLYAIWHVGDDGFLNNPGTAPWQEIFRDGGGLDLWLSDSEDLNRGNPRRVPRPAPPRAHAEGDFRLFVTKVNGEPRAVLFEKVSNAADSDGGYLYASPIMTGGVRMDRVRDVSDEMEFARKGAYIEISIPLSALPLTVSNGKRVLGDIGAVIGNGHTAIARSYWNNRSRTMTNDLPTEAEFWTQHMGVFEFRAER